MLITLIISPFIQLVNIYLKIFKEYSKISTHLENAITFVYETKIIDENLCDYYLAKIMFLKEIKIKL